MLSESLSEINSFLEVQESRVIKMVMFISECRSDGGGPEAALVRDTDNGETGVVSNTGDNEGDVGVETDVGEADVARES